MINYYSNNILGFNLNIKFRMYKLKAFIHQQVAPAMLHHFKYWGGAVLNVVKKSPPSCYSHHFCVSGAPNKHHYL